MLFEALTIGTVPDHAEHRVDPARAGRAGDLEDRAGVLDVGHPPDPADDERVLGDPVQTPVVEIGGGVA